MTKGGGRNAGRFQAAHPGRDTDDLPVVYVSPTEPAPLAAIGSTSSVPERYGVDVMWGGHDGLWGVQRKTVADFLASRDDGRLAKELGQMGKLDRAVLVVEGRIAWSSERTMMGHWTEMTQPQWHGMMWSVRQRGAWVDHTDDLTHTVDWCRWLVDWSRKPRHSGMRGRPKPASNWGKVTDREWAVHLLSGFEGIGPVMAERIYDHFGRAPLQWSVGEKELLGVKGMGDRRVRALMKATGGDGDG